MISKLPKNSKTLFQEVKIHELNLTKDRDFIIARVIEDGTLEDVKWLRQNYTNKDIEEVVKESRVISPITANFWKEILNIKGEIICMDKGFQFQRKKHWRV